MDARISDEQLSEFGEFVADKMGLHFPPSRWPDLRRGVAAVATELGFKNSVECIHCLMSTPWSKDQLDALATSLTVGETYFFRESKSFEVLSEHILPSLVSERAAHDRRLRIWSTACCTGEEPYSIAIALQRAIPNWEKWNITLLATDINPRFLRKAESGRFTRWSFRNAPSWLQDGYFRAAPDGQFDIDPSIKRMVHFAQLNLAEDVYPSLTNDTNAMDVIFCRNVLMYFSAAQAKNVIHKLYRAQTDDGWLVVGASELLHISSTPYIRANVLSAVLYRKQHSGSQSVNPIPSTAVISQPFLEIEERSEEPSSVTDSPLMGFGPHVFVVPGAADDRSAVDVASHPVDPFDDAVDLYRQGLYAEAEIRLKGILVNQPNNSDAQSLLVRTLANQGKLKDSLACCNAWIAADKLNPSAHYLRAIILQELGASNEILPALRNVLYLDPGFVLAHFSMANISQVRGDYHEARRHLRHVLQLLQQYKPDDVIPESEGITASRLTEIATNMMNAEVAA